MHPQGSSPCYPRINSNVLNNIAKIFLFLGVYDIEEKKNGSCHSSFQLWVHIIVKRRNKSGENKAIRSQDNHSHFLFTFCLILWNVGFTNRDMFKNYLWNEVNEYMPFPTPWGQSLYLPYYPLYSQCTAYFLTFNRHSKIYCIKAQYSKSTSKEISNDHFQGNKLAACSLFGFFCRNCC